MGFFVTFRTWLDGQLATYIGANTARLAAVLEPAMVTLATVYVMAWGYLHLTGKIDEPLTAGLKRIVTLAVVLGVGLRLWMYNALIVDTFYNAPAQLAASIIGGGDPVRIIDNIWDRGGAVANVLWDKGGIRTGLSFDIAAGVVWCLIGLLCVYAMFLIALSNIALAVLLALGPLFVVSLLFDGTKRFFSAWIAQLANYGLVTILTVMIAALLLQAVQSFAAQTAARGAAIQTLDALNMLLMSVLVFLILRQVMPIAAALAGGLALNTFGFIGRAAALPMRLGQRYAMPAVVSGASIAVRSLGRLAFSSGISVHDEAGRSGQDVSGNSRAGIEVSGQGRRSGRR